MCYKGKCGTGLELDKPFNALYHKLILYLKNKNPERPEDFSCLSIGGLHHCIDIFFHDTILFSILQDNFVKFKGVIHISKNIEIL